jgi:gluconate 2-dehydrogenase alpha chain
MCKVLNPKAIKGDAKKDGEHYNITKYQSHPHLRRRDHGQRSEDLGAEPLPAIVGRVTTCSPGANAFPQNNGYNPTGMVGALAYWTAKAIREQYLKNPGPLVQA